MYTIIKDNIMFFGYVLIFLIYSIYIFIEDKLAHQLLKIPYVLLLIIWIIFIVGLVKKKYKIEGVLRLLLIKLLILGSVYFSVTVVRFINNGFSSARPSLYLAMSILISPVILFAYYYDIFSYKTIKSNLVCLLTLVNLSQVLIGLLRFGGVRSSFLLENIMVYDFLVISTLPILFIFIMDKTASLKYKLMLMGNIVLGISLVTISGSRTSVALVWMVLFVSSILYISFYRLSALKRFVSIILIVICLIGFAYILDIMSARDSLSRTWFAYQGNTPVASNNDISNLEQNEQVKDDLFILENTQRSDSMRNELWNLSINEIKKSPIVGTGTVYFDCDYGNIVLQQGSHNIVMEVWLTFGLFGLVVYFLIFACIAAFFIFLITKTKDKLVPTMYLMTIAASFAISFFQPVMVMLIPNIVLWLIISHGIKTLRKKEVVK